MASFWKSLLAPLISAEAMGFSARRAEKGNEQGIRACGNFAVTWVPLFFPVEAVQLPSPQFCMIE